MARVLFAVHLSRVQQPKAPLLSSVLRIHENLLARLIKVTAAVSVLALFLVLPVISRFGFDAWSVFELTGALGRHFYETNTVREYATNGPYASSFAPVWPFVVAACSTLVNNIYACYVASFGCFMAFGFMAERFAKRAFNRPGIGALSALLLLRFIGLRTALGSGRSIPLFLFLLAFLGSLLFGLEREPRRRAAVAGMMAGLMVMSRFDAMPAAIVIMLGLPFIGVRGRLYAIAVGAFLITVSPWVLFSLVRFHTVFATDNHLVALAIDPKALVMDFHVLPPTTFFDAPGAWVAKVIHNAWSVVRELGISAVESVFLLPLLLCIGVIAVRERTSNAGLIIRPAMPAFVRRVVLLISLAAVAPVAGYIVTGHMSHWYFTATIWILYFLSLGYLVRADDRVFKAIALVFMIAAAIVNVGTLRYLISDDPLAFVRLELDHQRESTLADCMTHDGGDQLDAILMRDASDVNPAKFGATTNWRTLPLPSNWNRLSMADRHAFMKAYRVEYVQGRWPADEDQLFSAARPVSCPVPLHRFEVTQF